MNRAKELALDILCCSGRLTITSIIIAMGQQMLDWSDAYRIFKEAKMNAVKLFEINLKVCLTTTGLPSASYCPHGRYHHPQNREKVPVIARRRDP